MAQPLNPNSIVLARFVWTIAGHYAYVIRPFIINPRPPGMDTSHAAVLIDNQFAPILCGLTSQACLYQGTWVRRLLPAWDGSPDETHNGGPYPHYSLAVPLPPQVCGLIRFQGTHVAGPMTGRIFTPCPPEDASSNGAPTSAFWAALLAAGTQLITTHVQTIPPLATAAGARVVLYDAQAPRLAQATGVTASGKWATQRRRAGMSKRVAAPHEPGGSV